MPIPLATKSDLKRIKAQMLLAIAGMMAGSVSFTLFAAWASLSTR
ncbi:hypothetical protein [Rhizobium sp. ZX09]|nr:hypothetical protein [Rhizobium sp. ZX09]